jgi:site-specific recombinase XerD
MELQEALSKFIEYLGKNHAPSTVTAYKKDIEQLSEFLSSQEKIIDINKITTLQLIHYIDDLKKNKDAQYTLKTISRKINSMKTFFKYLYSERLIKENSAEQVEHPKYMISPPRILSKLEYRALRDVARYNLRLYTIVELLLQTGIRIGELARLTLDDLKLDGSKKSLHIKEFASNPERDVELNEPAEFALKTYLQTRPKLKNTIETLFVTKNGNPLLVRNIRTSISRSFEKAGIENATVNDIRNTFIVHQLKNGMPLEVVATIVGHQRLTSTKKYIKLIKIRAKRKTTKIVSL